MDFKGRQDDTDDLIGRLLAREIGDEGASGPCPDEEQIAALMDGGLGRGEREAVLTHLAGCEDCRELLRTAVMLSERERESRAPARTWRVGLLVPYAAAAALLVAVASAALFYKQTHLLTNGESVALNYTREKRLQVPQEAAPVPPADRNVAAPEASAPTEEAGSAGQTDDQDIDAMRSDERAVPKTAIPEKEAGSGSLDSVKLYAAPSMTELPEGRRRGRSEGYTGTSPGIIALSDMPERKEHIAGTKGLSAGEMHAENAPASSAAEISPEPAPPAGMAEPQILARTAPPTPPKAELAKPGVRAMAPTPAAEDTSGWESGSIGNAECAPATEGGQPICKLPLDKDSEVTSEARKSTATGPGELVKEKGTIKSIDAEKGEVDFIPDGGTKSITITVEKELLRGLKPGDKVMAQYEKGTVNVAKRLKKLPTLTIGVGC